MTNAGFSVSVERGAGAGSRITDGDFAAAGAALVDPGEAWQQADGVLCVGPPPLARAERLRPGALLVGLLRPHRDEALVRVLCDRAVTALALERVPRTSRAQAMDALTSQASIAGYRAALLVAIHLDKYVPLLMTAAGTVRPARVVVVGAGVAGLAAIGTLRRLGAVVEATDVRPEVREQVESLGARFVEPPAHMHMAAADAVITTALTPGRRAPVLLDENTVREMREGAVVVDLAAEAGGNCALTVPGETVVRHGVTIVGERDLAATMPADATRLYARNVHALLSHVTRDGALALDHDDDVTRAVLFTHRGQVFHTLVASPKEDTHDDGTAADRPLRLRAG